MQVGWEDTAMERQRLIVGITGASGMPIAAGVLRHLKKTDYETHLVMTRSAEITIRQETDMTPEDFRNLADIAYDNDDIGAAIASGSFKTAGMLVVPCSMKTLAGINSGFSEDLLLRAADVTLKERRKLVLCARECPLSSVHLRNMYELSMMGAVILPPMLGYYSRPSSVEACTEQIIGKLLDVFDIDIEDYKRWNGI